MASFRATARLVSRWPSGRFFSHQTASGFLQDSFGRKHDYLRISLTERCNLRCSYCMPEEGVPLSSASKLLTNEEIIRLARLMVTELGVKKIRLTGGEPLLRKGLVELVGHLKRIGSPLESIHMTTNGIVLSRSCKELAESGLSGVNISLDTLDQKKFMTLTRRRGWDRVMSGIETASSTSGLKVKLNCVVMRTFNLDEVSDFVALTRDSNLEIRFIEFMPFGGNKWSSSELVPSRDLLEIIRSKFGKVEPLTTEWLPTNTAKLFRISGHVGKFGFISSMSDNFCAGCNRLRITADGNLKVCLFGNEEVSLRDALRSECSDHELISLIRQALWRKKRAHSGGENIAKEENRPMILIEQATARYRKSPTHSIRSVNPQGTFMGGVAARSMSSITGKLTHLNNKTGYASMVNVSGKEVTKRVAKSYARVVLSSLAGEMISKGEFNKGNVLQTAQLAGIMGAKKASFLIPLAHSIPIESVNVHIDLSWPEAVGETAGECHAEIVSEVTTHARTGVEMEALTASAIAALTLYDMIKSVDKTVAIEEVRLLEKSGGKSGHWTTQRDTGI